MPEPISDEELVHHACSDDENGKEKAMQAMGMLVQKYINTMRPRIASLSFRTGIPEDDLIQEVSIAIIRAARTFRPEAGRKFSSHAYQWIRAALDNAVWKNPAISIPVRRRAKIRTGQEEMPQILSGDQELPGGEEVWDLIPDPGPEVAEFVEDLETAERVRAAVHQLMEKNPRWGTILRMRFWEDMTLEEIAQHFGVRRETIRQSLNRALDYLAQHLPAPTGL